MPPLIEPAATTAPGPHPRVGARVGVILVNWNGWQDTVRAYRSLKASSCRDWVAIVVDNASTDGSADRLAEALPEALLVRHTSNAGFAGGCNLGLRQAEALQVQHVFLLNNDAMVTPRTLDALLDASTRLGGRAVLGGVVKFWPNGQLQFFGSRTHPGHGRPQWYTSPAELPRLDAPFIDTDFVLGAALFAPMDLVHAVGGFDERFFLTFEETDWCYRARRSGFLVKMVSAAVVEHAGGASLGAPDAPMQTYFLQRNQLLFSDKHASRAQRWRAYGQAGRLLARSLRRCLRFTPLPAIEVDPSTQALLLALRDYLLRRFGDCPPAVRRLARQQQPACEPISSDQHRAPG
jgi:GT2 family glycosyltransferase